MAIRSSLSVVAFYGLLLAMFLPLLPADAGLSRRWFAWFFPKLKGMMKPNVSNSMCEFLGDPKGVLLEIGAGPGDMLKCLKGKTGITKWIAVEPNPGFRDSILRHAKELGLPFEIEVHTAGGEEISNLIPHDTVDFAYSLHVLCSIPAPLVPTAVQSISRVLKPGAQYRFFDHTSTHDVVTKPLLTTIAQTIASPFHQVIADGCEFRPVWEIANEGGILQKAGLKVKNLEKFVLDGVPFHIAPHVKGVAVKPEVVG